MCLQACIGVRVCICMRLFLFVCGGGICRVLRSYSFANAWHTHSFVHLPNSLWFSSGFRRPGDHLLGHLDEIRFDSWIAQHGETLAIAPSTTLFDHAAISFQILFYEFCGAHKGVGLLDSVLDYPLSEVIQRLLILQMRRGAATRKEATMHPFANSSHRLLETYPQDTYLMEHEKKFVDLG